MKERIDRQDDENFYQPKIHSDRIKELYKLSQETHLPMTVIVDYALRSYFQAFQKEKEEREQATLNAEWKMENGFDENIGDGEFKDMDQWEDGSLYGF
jgi:alpha-acetolactate decarboxylase